MAGGASVQFQSGAQDVTGGADDQSSNFGIMPPEVYPDANTPGKMRFIESINLWLQQGLRSAQARATSPHQGDVSSYYRSPAQDDPHMYLEAYHNLIQQLRDVGIRASGQPDKNAPEYGVKNPPVSILHQIGGDIHRLARQVNDYGVYREFLNYLVAGGSLSGSYNKWAVSKQVELSKTLVDDPVLKAAKANWGELSVEEKMKIAEHVHGLQARIYGFVPNQIIKVDKEDAGNFVVRMDQLDRTITVNTSSDIFSNTYENFVGTVVHEGRHSLQKQLIAREEQIESIEFNVIKNMGLQRYQDLKTDAQKQEFQKLVRDQIAKSGVSTAWDNRLGFFGDFRPEVMLWSLPYVQGQEDLGAYSLHPMEIDAHNAETGMNKFLMASQEERRRSISRIEGDRAGIIGHRDTITGQSSLRADSSAGLAWRPFHYSLTN